MYIVELSSDPFKNILNKKFISQAVSFKWLRDEFSKSRGGFGCVFSR